MGRTLKELRQSRREAGLAPVEVATIVAANAEDAENLPELAELVRPVASFPDVPADPEPTAEASTTLNPTPSTTPIEAVSAGRKPPEPPR